MNKPSPSLKDKTRLISWLVLSLALSLLIIYMLACIIHQYSIDHISPTHLNWNLAMSLIGFWALFAFLSYPIFYQFGVNESKSASTLLEFAEWTSIHKWRYIQRYSKWSNQADTELITTENLLSKFKNKDQ